MNCSAKSAIRRKAICARLMIGRVLIPELLALTIALTVYTAAFIAEIVRSVTTSMRVSGPTLLSRRMR